MRNNINYRLKTEMGNTLNVLQKVGQAYGNLGKNVSKSNAGFAKAFTSIKKTNRSFTNLTKDVNRANKSLIGMNGSLLNLRTLIGTIGFYRLAQGLTQAISSAMDMIETANLFSVAMGTLAVETNKALVEISSITGLDLTNMQTAVGTFGALSRSMGLTSRASQQLSTTTYRLGLDLASLYNVNINQALQDLRSGLVGQSETVYKYGIDVTEAALKVEALNQGITKSVRNMSQGEKMALRYAVMIRQSSVAHGDFARTLEQPANQLRILRERFVTLGRSIGTIFVPALQAVLPWLNAIVKVLINIANAIARIFGYDSSVADIWDFDSGVGGIADDANDLEDGLDGATGSAKKLKSALMGFDEINVLPSQDASAGGSAGGTGAIAGGVDMSWMEDLTYDSMFDNIKMKSDEIADGIKQKLDELVIALDPVITSFKKLWDEGLSLLGGFVWDSLNGFYEKFLVPVGKWVVGEGLPRFFEITNDLLKNIDWEKVKESLDTFWEALAPFATTIGDGLLVFYETTLSPFIEWATETIFPILLDKLSQWMTEMTLWMEENPNGLSTIATSLTVLWGALKLYKGAKWLAELDVIQRLLVKLGLLKGATSGVTGAFDRKNTAISKQTELTKKDVAQTGLLAGGVVVLGGIVAGLAKKWKENPIKFPEFEIPVPDFKPAEVPVLAFASFLLLTYQGISKGMETWFGEFTTSFYTNFEAFKVKSGVIAKEIGSVIAKNIVSGFISASTNLEGFVISFQTTLNSFGVAIATSAGRIATSFSKNISEGLRVTATNVWEFGKSSLSTIVSWGSGMLKASADTAVKFVNNIVSGLKTAWENFKNGLRAMGESISGFFKENKKVITTTAIVAGAVTLGALAIANPATVPFVASAAASLSRFTPSLVPTFASGGFPDEGQMFIAREAGAELVGNLGGRSAVVNNDQIIESISRGVYDAVSSAMGSNSGGGSIIVKIGEDTITEKIVSNINRQNRIAGKTVINV